MLFHPAKGLSAAVFLPLERFHEEIANLPDEAIDYSDIPELDGEFWQNAELVMPTDVEAQRAKNPKRVRAKKYD